MKIAMLQLNNLIGDFVGNTDKKILGYKKAVEMGAELVVDGELGIFGYPPKDMLCYKSYLDAQDRELERLAKKIGDIGLIVGIAERNPNDGKPLFNSAAVIRHGYIEIFQRKSLLPTYDVFDEFRYFEPGRTIPSFGYPSFQTLHKIGILICEDIWSGNENHGDHKLYRHDPVQKFVGTKIDHLIVINGSPYYLGKGNVRFDLVSGIARKLNCNVVYVNQVGGNDDLVFDGRSFAVNKNGDCIATTTPFMEDIVIVDTETTKLTHYPYDCGSHKFEMSNLYQVLVLGTRDYVRKNGFKKVVLGLSGGIDSALTACIAVDALEKENVVGVMMPSEFSSKGSVDDSKQLAENLGIGLIKIPIQKVVDAYTEELKSLFYEFQSEIGVAEENIQARARGNFLMALSNKLGWLVLSTGNKSELSVGYCTLYGDMAGGFAVISDIWKTQVYELARYVNQIYGFSRIPKNTIEKPPSAELRPDQKDTDSLPPYELLDDILQRYIEKEEGYDLILSGRTFGEIAEIKETVKKIIAMVNRAEHKRKQMPLGIKTSRKAYGSGRRWPIAAKNL